ncbi:3'-phosphoadenosine 5'-phosphosulfate sulfotransferase [Rhizina undulata]
MASRLKEKALETSDCSTDACCRQSSLSQDQLLLDISFKLNQKITAFLETETQTEQLRGVQRQTAIALEVVEEALDKYTLDELAISYNGGKDCLVLLTLFLAGLARKAPRVFANDSAKRRLLHSVYVMSEHPFQEIDDFVDTSAKQYQLDLVRYALPMKLAFETYLQEKPAIKAIFVGTRRTDPHGEFLTHFDMTDHGWPEFMRIHPVVDWHYQDVWTFLRHLDIPYCSLYDKGYTSLGGTIDTLPNPALLDKTGIGGPEEEPRFRPAYELIEDDQERLGRDR